MERLYAAERAAEAADEAEEDEDDEDDEDDDEEKQESDDERAGASDAVRIVITTNGGLEGILRDELLDAAHAACLLPPVEPSDVVVCPWGCLGRVLLHRPRLSPLVESKPTRGGSGSGALLPDEAELEQVLLGLRTAHDVLWHHGVHPLPETADPPLTLYDTLRVASLTAGGPCASLTGGRRSFRVSCVREGEHAFTSLDIEREVGGALHELYGAPVAMKAFDLRVRVDVANRQVLVGTAVNAEPLSRRHKLAFTRSVTLKPNVAHALLRLGGCTRTSRLLDPCCGSGTIPLEAAQSLGAVAVGIDKSERVVQGAVANARAADLEASTSFRAGNCRRLDRLFAPASFDLLVTNAPWGLQTAKGGDGLLDKIYYGLLTSAHAVVRPGGRAVILVLRWPLLLELARRSGVWAVVELVPIRTSNLTPVALVLESLESDPFKAQVAERLAPLQAFYVHGGAAAEAEAAHVRIDEPEGDDDAHADQA